MRGRLAAVIAAASLVLVGGAVPAYADPGLGTAKARAALLRRQVDALELKAAVAIEDYNEVSEELARLAYARLEAQKAVDSATQARHVDRDALETRIRAIYMSGGTMSLYASVLEAPDLHDAFGRLANVSAVLREDGLTVDSADVTVAKAQEAADKLREITVQQAAVEKKVATAAERVRTALAKQKSLLAAADAEVVRLAEEARIAAEARAAAAFAARVAAAEARAAGAGGAADSRTHVSGAALAALRDDSTTPPNAVVAKAIAAAKTRLGSPYVWGATGPETFDCSGLTGWAYRQAGLNLPRTSRQQWFAGSHPSVADLLPGDLLFWGPNRSNPQSIHHVAMYIGGGMMIAAPRTGTVVRIQPVYQGDFFGVTRVAP